MSAARAADGGESASVKSAKRVLELLELFGEAAEPLTATEIAARTGFPRSSLHGLLQTLLGQRWIEEVDPGRFTISTLALSVGVSYIDRDPAAPHATAALERLRTELGCTTNLARRIGDEVIYLATREAADRRSLPSRTGRRVPAFATALGRALLAELTDEEVREELERHPRLQVTSSTTTDLDELLEEIRAARTNGHAIERSQTLDDVVCVAVVVPYRLPATDAISCSMSLAQATPERLEEVIGVLEREVAGLASQLRWLGIR
ncbi:IclR family transcriptional regulator [Agromyces sp. ISL-38]|uniref:IclR family transcriptional regulator n=1 Tax=Agromyces sp. ISL-38 TaxID=2819107 RepID=UPI001BEBE207|nr:IclR family transcriptional regulator [Agromyces sp. ISL-38]MBT2497930.1 IclR family transcriptional regulator [Agromyces sp. ISL-38]